jgi:hypothetical protein
LLAHPIESGLVTIQCGHEALLVGQWLKRSQLFSWSAERITVPHVKRHVSRC